MINYTVKLMPTPRQERQLKRWLVNLTGVFNWAVRKIELDAADRRYYSLYDFKALLNGHGAKVGIPVQVLQEVAAGAYQAWRECFSGLKRKPRLKGRRRRLNWIVFRQGSQMTVRARHVDGLAVALGSMRFHRQEIPSGTLKRVRVIKRASGWYGVLTIDADPAAIPSGSGSVGIDPGFSSLLTLSTGEKIDRATELSRSARRLAQAQRGCRHRLTARLQERVGWQRKDRNHKLSRRLVSENQLIAWSKDRHSGIAKKFGKSVQSSAHYQLREMLLYKSLIGGAQFLEVDARNSTRRCSACQALTGPTGWAGLKVRVWDCSACGAHHDRDINAAVNTLKLGQGICHESGHEAVSGIATKARRRSSSRPQRSSTCAR